jgi:glutamate carboxypeptidase
MLRLPPAALDAAAWLETQSQAMLRELIALCDLNSGSDHLPGLLRVADHLQVLFSDLDIPCVRLPLSGWEVRDDAGRLRFRETGPALQWSYHPANLSQAPKPATLLAIHYDTVYGPDHPLQECRRVDDDRCQGPGVIDAKGGIIVLRWAILAGLRFGLLKDRSWSIVLNPDEELGSPASRHLWRQVASGFQRAMLFEPAMSDGSLVGARKGSGNFLVVVHGRAAHAGRHFELGRNAVVRASSVAVALHGLNGRFPGVTINVGRMVGGDAVNVVPDRCIVRFNARVEDPAQQAWVLSELEGIRFDHHSDQEGFHVEVHGGFSSPPKVIDAATRHWQERITQIGQGLGQSIRWASSGGASDGNKLAELGLMTLDSFGPEGDGLHSPNEWVRISSLPRKAALTLAILCDDQDLPTS